MASVGSINQEIAQQTALLNELRLNRADAAAVDEVKKKLGELKRSLASLNSGGGAKDAGKKKERLLLKTAKVSAHTQDHLHCP